MFNDVFDFTKKRDFYEAIGFYIVYTFIMFIIALLTSSFISNFVIQIPDIPPEAITVASAKATNTTYVLFMGALLISVRKIIDTQSLVIILVSWMLTFMLTGIVGMMGIAYLTTRQATDHS